MNAGNVLGTEDNLPAKKWVSLVRRTLNKNPGSCCYGGYRTPSPVPDPVVEQDADFEGSSRRLDSLSYLHRRSFNLSRSLRVEGNHMLSHQRLDRRFSVCDPVSLGSRPSDFDRNFPFMGSPDDHCIEEDTSNEAYFSPFPYGCGASAPMEENDYQPNTSRYFLVDMFHKSLHMCVLVYNFYFLNHSACGAFFLTFYVPENDSINVVFLPGIVWLPASKWSVYFSPFGCAAK